MLVVYEDFDGYGGLDGWQDRSCQCMTVWMSGKIDHVSIKIVSVYEGRVSIRGSGWMARRIMSVHDGLDGWQARSCQYRGVWMDGKIDHVST